MKSARELAHWAMRLLIGEDCGSVGDTCDADCDAFTAAIESRDAEVIEACAVAARTDISYGQDAVNEVIGRIRALTSTIAPRHCWCGGKPAAPHNSRRSCRFYPA